MALIPVISLTNWVAIILCFIIYCSAEGHIADIYYLGDEKTGSTSIFKYFRSYGFLCPALTKPDMPEYLSKEIHYLDGLGQFYDKNSSGKIIREEYMQRFNQTAACEGKRIDFTPSIKIGGIFEKINQVSLDSERKKLKFAFAIREPMQKALSWYNHRLGENQWYGFWNDNEKPSFYSDRILKEMVSHYEEILRNLLEYQKYFKPEQLHISIYERWKSNPLTELKHLAKHFGFIDNINFNFTKRFPYANERPFPGKLNISNIDCKWLKELSGRVEPVLVSIEGVLLQTNYEKQIRISRITDIRPDILKC